MHRIPSVILLVVSVISCLYLPAQSSTNIGIFEGNSDVGNVLHKGSTQYDANAQVYTLTGAGSNIWFKKDELQYAWKKLKGDFILQTRIAFEGNGVDPHRKVGWMIRNTLDTGSVMACATVHGDGLTSLYNT